jgi:hypothetical protein
MTQRKSSVKKINLKPKKEDEKKLYDKATEDIKPEDPFDFGGLPLRNLKKNLGCG